MIEIIPRKNKKDKDQLFLTLALALLAQFYTVKINGVKWVPPKK